MHAVPALLQAGKRVIDLSGDFRLNAPEDYPRWYQFTHAHAELLGAPGVVYGLTEYAQDAIRRARLIANPGCYATSVLLGVLPLCEATLLGDGPLIVDAKSGLSGAGRKADESLLFTEMAENLRAYKVNSHQHMPEMLQAMRAAGAGAMQLAFVPQVIPATRGLISMIYLRTRQSAEQVLNVLQRRYAAEKAPFVRVRREGLPELSDVVGTNYCDLGASGHPDGGLVVIASALDNLIKGAAGQAVQNFNVMHGFNETTGLR
jgi:N-acetyl-gamma-glutamyl-phosphate reductase